MPCKLGLRNPDGAGGKYKGKGIGAVLRDIRTCLQTDGYLGGDEDVVQPHVFYEFTRERVQMVTDGREPFMPVIERDQDLHSVECLGFGMTDWSSLLKEDPTGDSDTSGWKNDCEGCPYLQKSRISAER